MANASIRAAFERMWQHINIALNNVSTGLDPIKVHFPFRAVNAGDCIIIETGSKVILIDCGVVDTQNLLINYMTANGINKIDYFFISHFHHDHIGNATGVTTILDSTQIDTSNTVFYLPHGKIDWTKCADTDGSYTTIQGYQTTILNKLASTGNSYIYPTENQTLKVDDCEFKFMNLTASDFTAYYNCYEGWNYKEQPVPRYNNFSMVVEMTHGDKTFLFTGDIEELAQEKIWTRLKKPDVLKIEHHCCNYGTYDKYARLLEPEIAITCDYEAGWDNMMKRSTFNIIDNCADIYGTNVSGDIVVTSNGLTVSAESQYGRINGDGATDYADGKGIPVDDLDNLFAPGVYFTQDSAKTSEIANVPEYGSGFKLVVEALSPGTQSTRQTFIRSNSRNCNIYTRTYWDGYGWYPWTSMTPFSEGISLKSGDDLNACLMKADYCSSSESVTSGIANIPDDLDSGFKLINHYVSTNTLKQIIYPNSYSEQYFYMRTIDLSTSPKTFTNWYKFEAGKREVWSGSWSKDSITITDADHYRLFLVILSGKDTVIPVVQYNGVLRGSNGYPYSTETYTTYEFAATVSGSTYTFVRCGQRDHTASGHGSWAACTVSKIIAIA